MKTKFNFLFCLILAMLASITSVKADVYYHVEIVPVLENGATGLVYACPYASANMKYYNYLYNMGKENKWTTHFDETFSKSSGNPDFYIMAFPGDDKRSIFAGWYWDEACTVPIKSATSTPQHAYCKYEVYGSGFGKTLTSYATAAEAEQSENVITIYARFVKAAPAFDWSTMRATPTSGEKYYVYSPVRGCFLKAPKGTASSTNMPKLTANPSEATLFTYTWIKDGTKNTCYDEYGVKEDRSYKEGTLTYQDGETTKYASAYSYSYWTNTSSPNINHTLHFWSWASMDDKTFVLAKADASSNDYIFNELEALYFSLNASGTSDIDIGTSTGSLKRTGGIYWMFIPEEAFFTVAEVSDVNENGTITITSSPTATGTANVKFNVSVGSVPAAFDYELSGADASHWALGTPTCSDGILTVPVTYTAQNTHSGTSTPASMVTVTVTAQNEGASTASGTASAYTDFEPRFALTVNSLDWSRVGEEVVETFYSGQEIAASQRDRLANKLIKVDAQTTGVAANNATWTATITGTNADQFKFANGTQTVSGLYTSNLLDVHYAPTTTGNHEATLHIVTSYTDANSHTETVEHDITLRGIGSAASRITFAKAGNQLPTNAESHNFGEIIGTNHLDITADLFISQITNPQMVWNDPDGQFVFVNQASVDLTQLNQTLTFRAKRTSPVETNTVHTATLTVSGKGTANEDVSATITLTYTALPLIQTTVTWNWATIKENNTISTPITTNSDGAWTLAKSVGDKITYNNEEKTATAAYLHHEPGVTAEFVLNIPQTDTYTAFDAEYETMITRSPENVCIDRQEYLGDDKAGTEGVYGKVSKWASSWETWDDATKTLQVRGDKIWFYFSGQTKFEFEFEHTETSAYSMKWYLYEYDANNTQNIIWNTSFTPTNGHYVINISPNTVKVEMKGKGKLSNIHFYEYDTISADKEQVALVYDNGNVSTLDVSTTFANKRQVTVSLNATAAQYFEISTTGKATGSSMVFDSNDGLGIGMEVNNVFTVAIKEGVNISEARAATAGNACQLIFADDYTYNHEVLSLPILVIEPCEITYANSANGSYTVTYQNDGVDHLVDNEDYIKTITTATPSEYVVTINAPVPASGYIFQGWKVDGELISCRETFTTSVGIDGSVVEAVFIPTEAQNFKVGDVYFAEFNAALSAAEKTSDKIVAVANDVTLGDGENTFNYTIPAGVTLLVPHKADFYELQEVPDLVNVNSESLEAAQKLSAYRTLTLKEGVTITCNGTICVAGNMVTANGGRKSAYPTGEVGLINMVHGGHIELNNGANLYCWGYIKGQDMDQGNNTVGIGTVTANAGSVVWENFELGDWRGGSASLDIYNNNVIDHRKLFPFQSYAIQNIEIPTTFKYGSVLKNYTSITTGYGDHGAVFSMIGPSETMFLLTDEQSVVRTWYDPTTDLSCYELSGTAQLDALHITVYVSMSSEDFILPIANSMHIILKDCNMTLANSLMVQAGAVIEIKPSATVNLTSELYMYDVDQWGKYVHNYYFRSFNNITSHKNRGAENSKAGLEDAKFIVDGIFNVNSGGKLYTTKGGANIMGNGGGIINFNAPLPDSIKLYAVEVFNKLPYITWVWNRVYAANLCNEDGSYTRSIGGGYSFHNVNGRWFETEDKDELEDHTYAFTYMDGGNMGENDIVTAAVYSNDKTGLEARMKWFNVSEDACANWWTDAAGRFYNYTMMSAWHQFMATEQANVYSGSDNKLYQKIDCVWIEEGAVDENCLYTIDGVKKALVDGHFVALTPNGYDAAYHATANAEQYYICFTGCNWHEATPYTGEQKAYTIAEGGTFIWFNNDWMAVEREEPFFYTADEQTNVKTFYEYLNGDWVVATPYVSVIDDAETRNFYSINEAFRVASIKKNATIKLLRDLPNTASACVFETQNTTCTLDLNGHVLGGAIANLVTVNAPGCTFTITDNAALKIGKITTTQSKAVYAQKGTMVLSNGTLEATGAYAIECAAAGTITINGGYLAANTKCVNVAGSCSISGGHFTDNANLATYAAAHKYPFETTDPKYKYEVSDAWTITFKDGETTLQTLHLKPGETPAYTANQPTKADNKFTGWSPAIVAATADATYTAQFAATSGESCVTLNSNGGNEGLQYVYVTTGSAIGTLPTGTTKDGYTFAGWFTGATNGAQITTSTTVSADVTWYAHYTKNSYTLTWDANGGELSGSYTSGLVAYGAAITAPTATMDGHTFLCWNATPATTMPAQDVTYTAQWSIAAKHYLQNIDGTYPETPEATENVSGEAGEYVTPAVKTYDGFITPATQTVRIGAETEVTYNYVRREYTINWEANGGTCATPSTTVKHGATLSLPEATLDDYTFEGWFTKAVGGDQITASTVIQRNIGTLYAHWQAEDLEIGVNSTETLSANTTKHNLVLASNGSTSGQLKGLDTYTLTLTGDAYFDLNINAAARTWYAVAVPWQVNVANGVLVNGVQQTVNSTFYLLTYSGAVRAASGAASDNWIFASASDIMQPGTLYMIYLTSPATTIRFKKKSGAAISTTSLNVQAYDAVDPIDAGWNGIANPSLYHAYLNASSDTYNYEHTVHTANFGQRYIPVQDRYEPVNMSDATEGKLIVGAPIFVQVAANKAVTAEPDNGSFSAPARRKSVVDNAYYEVHISAGEEYTDRIYLQTLEDKEDTYVIGLDLAKAGVSTKVAQMWVNRYNAKLCVNTTAPQGSSATYPLGIFAPQDGDYQIYSATEMQSGQEMYVTMNGRTIWNLAYGPYTVTLTAGTHNEYGLKLIQAPAATTGIDPVTNDQLPMTNKVVIDDHVYIIRDGEVYTVTGQKVQ